MNLTNITYVKELLAANGFDFKKSLGQNFIISPHICPKMAKYAANPLYCNADSGKADSRGLSNVIEIGAGVGVLTRELSAVAAEVRVIEIDERLRPVLDVTLGDLGNAGVIYADVMKLDLSVLSKTFKNQNLPLTVCANLPYYITTPVITRLLESGLPINAVICMVQQEVAERLTAEVGNRKRSPNGSRAAGAITVFVNFYAEPKLLFHVKRSCFMPQPNVDSAVIMLKMREETPKTDKDIFFKTVHAGFGQRRKQICAPLSAVFGMSKDDVKAVLRCAGVNENARAEELTMRDFILLSECLRKRITNDNHRN